MTLLYDIPSPGTPPSTAFLQSKSARLGAADGDGASDGASGARKDPAPTLHDVAWVVAAFQREIGGLLVVDTALASDERLLDCLAHESYNDGRTRLHHAALTGRADRVRLLLAHGAAVDAVATAHDSVSHPRFAKPVSPLRLALTLGHVEAAQVLIE